MDATLHALGGLVLRAVPTFLLVIALNYYLKAFFFKPLEKTLRERYDATGGALKLAGEITAKASAAVAKYDAAVRAARAEAYAAQERARQQAAEQRAAELAAARKRADAVAADAKAQLAAEVETARASLARDAQALSDEIAGAVLNRSAA